jgi:Zn-dependent protease
MNDIVILAIVFAVQFTLVFGSIVLHEIAHGYTAWRLGDPTARMQGRITLNPLAHIDPFGTILLPLFLAYMNMQSSSYIPIIGWAKPVPINPGYFRDPLRGMMLTGLAGPLTNFAIALGAALLFWTCWFVKLKIAMFLCGTLFGINVYLGLFNLLPVPPLDGSRVVAGLIPRQWVGSYLSIERYGIFILYGIIFMGLHRHILDPIYNLAMKLIGE